MPITLQPGDLDVTLDIAERQILVEYEGDQIPYRHRILALRIEGSIWAVIAPTLDVHEEDFGGANVVPLLRHSHSPRGGRPFFAFAPLGAEQMVCDIGGLLDSCFKSKHANYVQTTILTQKTNYV